MLGSDDLGKSNLLPALMKPMICYGPVGLEVMPLHLDPSGTCEMYTPRPALWKYKSEFLLPPGPSIQHTLGTT